MRKVLLAAPVAALVLGGFVNEASAQATATATFEVAAINEISVSGNPSALVIDSKADIDAGVTDVTTTWGITTNAAATSPMKVTGALDSAMQTSTQLFVTLGAPTTGTSASAVELSATAADLVTGISQVNQTSLPVTYLFKATESAAVGTATRTVTYTITADV